MIIVNVHNSFDSTWIQPRCTGCNRPQRLRTGHTVIVATVVLTLVCSDTLNLYVSSRKVGLLSFTSKIVMVTVAVECLDLSSSSMAITWPVVNNRQHTNPGQQNKVKDEPHGISSVRWFDTCIQMDSILDDHVMMIGCNCKTLFSMTVTWLGQADKRQQTTDNWGPKGGENSPSTHVWYNIHAYLPCWHNKPLSVISPLLLFISVNPDSHYRFYRLGRRAFMWRWQTMYRRISPEQPFQVSSQNLIFEGLWLQAGRCFVKLST